MMPKSAKCGDCYWHSPIGDTVGKCMIPIKDVVPLSIRGIIEWEGAKFEHPTMRNEATGCPFVLAIGCRSHPEREPHANGN